jgi:hypothetical protein
MSMIIEQGSILSLDVLDDDGPTPLFEQGKLGTGRLAFYPFAYCLPNHLFPRERLA